jgi:hypothetical protein
MGEPKVKSTIQTSRKVYAMKLSFTVICLLTTLYGLISIFSKNTVDGLVFVTAIGAIGTIVGTLNVADGMKKGE